MNKNLLVFGSLFIFGHCLAQHADLQLGKVTYADLEMKSYPQDTSAEAVVLNEFGQAYISNDEGNLIFEHYIKIKILSRNGLHRANFSVPLHKQNGDTEKLLSVEASTFNLEHGSLHESKLDPKNVFTENSNQYTTLKKLALPDVREGSVFEIKIITESPFIFTFQPWEFQSDIPTIRSEYWAFIPGNYVYNITLRGFLKLTKNENSIVNDCYTPEGGNKADCVLYKFGLDHVPALKEEEYMTAKENFLSAVYFELSEVHRFDGLVKKYTKEWRDIDNELRQEKEFGQELRKAKSLWEDKVKATVGGETNELVKAKLIFNLIKSSYAWNEDYGKYPENGVKKALDSRAGNVADINLSLVAALQDAELSAFPVILSTRDHGLPIEANPVMSNFNYVVASVEIGGKSYLLDATYGWQPFGLLPLRCLNGKGRLLTKVSSWIELKPSDKIRTVIVGDLMLSDEGNFQGKFTNLYQGYDAVRKRSEVFSAGDAAAYLVLMQKKLSETEISDYHLENLKEVESPLKESMTVSIKSDLAGANTIYFSPFTITDKWGKNPFKSNERIYPVDFGAPIEELSVLSVTIPANMEIDELPKNVALSLPDNGGKYLFSVTRLGNKLSVVSNLTLTKPIYTSVEYHYLRELFARVVQNEGSQIVFKRK